MGLFYKANKLFEKKKPVKKIKTEIYSCSKCKKEINLNDKVCPSCNTELIDEKMIIEDTGKSSDSSSGWVSGCIGFIVTFMIIFFIMTSGSHEQNITVGSREFLPVLVTFTNKDKSYTIKEMKIGEAENIESENIEISYLIPEINIKSSPIKSSFKIKKISENKQEITLTASRLYDGEEKINYIHCYDATRDNINSKSYKLLNLPGPLLAISLMMCFVLNIGLWILIKIFRFIKSRKKVIHEK